MTSATNEQSMKQPSLGTDFSNEYIAELWRMKRMAVVTIQSPFAWDGLLYVTSGSSGGQVSPSLPKTLMTGRLQDKGII